MKKMLGLVFSFVLVSGALFASENEVNPDSVIISRIIDAVQVKAVQILQDATTQAEAIMTAAQNESAECKRNAQIEAENILKLAQAEAEEIKKSYTNVLTARFSNGLNSVKDFAQKGFEKSKVTFNDGCDFVTAKWNDNPYYLKPVICTGGVLVVIAVAYKVAKKVLEKINEDNQDNK
jgi:hypothetical protein